MTPDSHPDPVPSASALFCFTFAYAKKEGPSDLRYNLICAVNAPLVTLSGVGLEKPGESSRTTWVCGAPSPKVGSVDGEATGESKRASSGLCL